MGSVVCRTFQPALYSMRLTVWERTQVISPFVSTQLSVLSVREQDTVKALGLFMSLTAKLAIVISFILP